MKVYNVLLVVIIIIGAVAALGEFNDNATTDPKIIGGMLARRNEYPFIVSYQALVDGRHYCGGSILSPDWIVIAAHCMANKDPHKVRVVAGMLNQGESHPDIQIVSVYQQITHPNYPGGTVGPPCDIGLIKLAWSLKFNRAVKAIYLPQQGQEYHGTAWTAGWGAVSSTNAATTKALKQAELILISHTQCANDLTNIIGHYGNLNTNMVCGRGAATGSETVCYGDFGGPLVQTWDLVGISSWTVTPCGTYLAPSVYTKVSQYVSWIRNYVH